MITSSKRHFRRLAKKIRFILPHSLWGRSLLLVILPIVCVQFISGYVFFKQYLRSITIESSKSVAGNIALAAYLWDKKPFYEEKNKLQKLIRDNLRMNVITSKGKATYPSKKYYFQSYFKKALAQVLKKKYWIKNYHGETAVGIPFGKETLVFFFPTQMIFSRTKTLLWILWSCGSALLFSLVALYFLRRQIQPLQSLDKVAFSVSKGEKVPRLRLRGAREIRHVTKTFLTTYQKLKETYEENSLILNGISHDLRTPLQRMKLQLALMENSQETKDLTSDVNQMIFMIESYFSFIQKRSVEKCETLNIETFFKNILKKQPQTNFLKLTLRTKEKKFSLPARTIERCLQNLLDNAMRYMNKKVECVVCDTLHTVVFEVHDDGPGVKKEHFHSLSKSFFRLDDSRNLKLGGVGLGLAVVQKILLPFQGTLHFEKSPLGGLKSVITFPLKPPDVKSSHQD
jgi:two-component system osmolarity sensor histidine kinase EnvZ